MGKRVAEGTGLPVDPSRIWVHRLPRVPRGIMPGRSEHHVDVARVVGELRSLRDRLESETGPRARPARSSLNPDDGGQNGDDDTGRPELEVSDLGRGAVRTSERTRTYVARRESDSPHSRPSSSGTPRKRFSERINLYRTQSQAEQLRDEADRLRAQIQDAYAAGEVKEDKINQLRESLEHTGKALGDAREQAVLRGVEIQSRDAELQKSRSDVDRLSKELSDREQASRLASERLASLGQDIHGLNRDLEQLRASDRAHAEEAAAARRVGEAAEQTIAQLREQINLERREHSEALRKLNAENSRLESELRRCVADLEQRNLDHSAVAAERDSVARRLSDAQSRHEEAAQGSADLAVRLRQSEADAEQARETLEEKEADIMHLREKNDQLIRLLDELEREREARAPEKLEREQTVLREELACMEAEVRRLQITCTQQQRELIAHEARGRDYGTDVAMWHAHATESQATREHQERELDFAHQDLTGLTARLRSRIDEARSRASMRSTRAETERAAHGEGSAAPATAEDFQLLATQLEKRDAEVRELKTQMKQQE